METVAAGHSPDIDAINISLMSHQAGDLPDSAASSDNVVNDGDAAYSCQLNSAF